MSGHRRAPVGEWVGAGVGVGGDVRRQPATFANKNLTKIKFDMYHFVSGLYHPGKTPPVCQSAVAGLNNLL
jgi:hypothetical protein